MGYCMKKETNVQNIFLYFIIYTMGYRIKKETNVQNRNKP